MPVQLIALPQTPVRPVDDPVQKQPGPVQPGGGVAKQELPFQPDPVAHTPCEVADCKSVPPSEISKIFDPKLTCRGVPADEAASEKTVPL